MFTEHGGKSLTLVSDREGVIHFAFRCDDHDVLEMADCPLCVRAMKSVGDIKDLRRDMPEFDPDQLQAFWGGWSASAA